MKLTATIDIRGLNHPKTEQILQQLCDPAGALIELPTLIVCAHPDDESIGVGTRLTRLKNVVVAHVTDGAPREMSDALRNGFPTPEAYSRARRGELEHAISRCGLDPEQLYELGFPDQGALQAVTDVARAVLRLLERFKPVFVITHPYEGGHPDHDATAFAVHCASALFQKASGFQPIVVEMTSYHNAGGTLRAGRFLESSGDESIHTAWLTPSERTLKKEMFACFQTQTAILEQFPIDEERFRQAPRYDFTLPPHPGTLFYEMHPWGMSGERFRIEAAAALKELGLTE